MSDKLTDHDYDGIKEYDNPLPNWWLIGFMITIIFSFFYFLHYEVTGNGPNPLQELKNAMAALPKPSNDVSLSEESLLAAIANPESKKLGAEIFSGKCAVCHGQQGEGLIGPNLTDNFWLNGKGKATDVMAVVKNGVVEKGMPPWEAILNQEEMVAVTSFILGLKGSKPLNAKAPQGSEFN